MRRAPSARRGFTLAEQLAVVTVVGVAMAMALPRMRTGQSRVDAFARMAATALVAAQREAVVRQHNVLVVFDTTAGAMRTVWDANNNARRDAGERVRVTPMPDGVTLRLPAGVPAVPGAGSGGGQPVSDSEGPALLLQRSGSANQGATVYLTTKGGLRSALRDVRALRVERATGQPIWFAWTGSRWRRG
ncbi:MAG: type II secretion system GspH family protein [Gemmatimonadetes bacterium]|nr:type II secretion system GspH family protein [Gemmatimonadota bacterium]